MPVLQVDGVPAASRMEWHARKVGTGRFGMIDGGRAHELAERAVRELATGSGTLAERPRDAWRYHLMLLILPGVPWPNLAEQFRNLADYFQTDPKVGRLIIEGLSVDDQRRIAGEVFDFYARICGRWPPRSE